MGNVQIVGEFATENGCQLHYNMNNAVGVIAL